MNWEETIRYIRTQPEYHQLVEMSYLDKNLRLNVERFISSDEFKETLKLVHKYAPSAKSILDIGAGNGISSIAFALKGYQVTVVEPDPSDTVGCGAIEILRNEFHLSNINIINSFGEKLPLPDNHFDVVYIRQAMHHAAELDSFLREAARVLAPEGVLVTIRDHVIYNKKDKQEFLDTHPLQKFYGGENAFTKAEYSEAMLKAGLKIKSTIGYYDSIINFFPQSPGDVKNIQEHMRKNFRKSMQKRFGSWIVNFPFLHLLELAAQFNKGKWDDDIRVPGRMYSFIAIKNPS
ncbi:MAG: class I SAM-dependent methyltransferase [Bacteroidota bacterium]